MSKIAVVNVLVTHENAMMAMGLAEVLGQQPEFSVSVHADGLIHDAAGLPERRVDVVVTSHLGGLGIATGLKQAFLARQGRQPRVLVVSSHHGEWEVRSALEAGVHGYLLQGCTPSELLQAAFSLASGSRHLCNAAAHVIAESLSRVNLTGREFEVLEQLSEGLCNKLIARRLGIASGTVKAHIAAILVKLGASTRTQATAIALQRGLLRRRQVPFYRMSEPGLAHPHPHLLDARSATLHHPRTAA